MKEAVGISLYGAAPYLIGSPPKPFRIISPRCSYWRTPRCGSSSTGSLDGATKSEQTDRCGQHATDKDHGGDVHVLGGHQTGPSILFGPIIHRWVELCPGWNNQSVRHFTPNNFSTSPIWRHVTVDSAANVRRWGHSGRARLRARTSLVSQKPTLAAPQRQRQFGTLRCRWREPSTASTNSSRPRHTLAARRLDRPAPAASRSRFVATPEPRRR